MPNLKNELSPRDQLTSLFLQFQRTLILSAIHFYERRENLKLSPQILDLHDEKQILVYLNFCRSLQQKPLVRLGTWFHELLDRSKSLKSFSVSVLLFTRTLFRSFSHHGQYGPYDKWVAQIDDPSPEKLASWHQTFKAFAEQKLSIVMTPQAFDENSDFSGAFKAAEIYKPNWIVWGWPKTFAVDPSVIYVESQSFHQDLQRVIGSSGSYILFQTEPGELSKSALAVLFEFIQQELPFLVAFGDGDTLSKKTSRTNPRFYPKWNLRYFVGDPCLRGVLLFQKDGLLNFLKDKTFSSWQDFIAELAIQLDDNQVAHISKVLFHSRFAEEPKQELLLSELDRKLIQKYNAKLEPSRSGAASIVWPLPQVLPKVSILIPTRDRSDLVRNLIDGLLNCTDYDNYEIVLIDNQSSDPKSLQYFESLRENPKVKICKYDFPFNYSAINNFGFQLCKGEVLALLNNDLEIMNPNWLKEMLREVLAPQVGIVGAKLYFKNKFIQHAGVVLGSGISPHHVNGMDYYTENGYRKRLRFSHQLSAVTAACMLMRRETFMKVNGFNEKNLSIAYNDIDLCLRVAQLGLKIVWTPKAELYHLESASRPPDRRPEQIARYRKEVDYMRTTWKELTHQDPYYNLNLSRQNCDFKVSIDE